MLDGQSILITGGTGSFGQKLTETILARYKPRKLIIFSRDEQKHFAMSRRFPEADHPCLRYFIGDIRDRARLEMAFQDVDYVVHAAAMKHVPLAEYNPIECVRTNIMGAQNIIEVATAARIQKVIALSTDKACNPVNLYGATKLASDKLLISANNYGRARYSVVRYGNVIGSKGSVVPFFLSLRGQKEVPVTDPGMTRFWITLRQSVDFVLARLLDMHGGELFVPRIPSMRITDLIKVTNPGASPRVIGIRPGEKMHEMMISVDDARNTEDMGDHYVVTPNMDFWKSIERPPGRPLAKDFEYASDKNDQWMGEAEMRDIIDNHLATDMKYLTL